MPLESRTLPLKLGKLDSKTDPRWVMAGDLVTSQNLIFDTWPKIKKRNGHKQIAALAAATGAQLATFKNQLLAGSGTEAFGNTASGLTDKGPLENLTVSAQPIQRDAFVETTPDSAAHPAGVTVYTWETAAGGSQYSVFDTVTGQPLIAGVSLGATVSSPKPLVLGAYVVIVFFNGTNNRIQFVAISALTPATVTSPVDLAANSNTTPVFDATVAANVLYLVYSNNAGSNKITITSMSAALVIGSQAVPVTTDTLNTCCSICAVSGSNATSGLLITVIYYNGSSLNGFGYDSTLSVLLQPFFTLDSQPGTLVRVTSAGLNSRLCVFYEVGPSSRQVKSISVGAGFLGVGTGFTPLLAPTGLVLTQVAGSLGAGTYFYRVATGSPGTSGAASLESSITITGGHGVSVAFTPVAGATLYTLYGRGPSGTENSIIANSGSPIVDDGSITPNVLNPATNYPSIASPGPSSLRSVGLASKPFTYQGRPHVLVTYQSTLQSTYFLASVTSAASSALTIVAKIAPAVGGGFATRSLLPEVNNPSPGVFKTTYLQTTEIGVQAGAIFSQAGVMAGTLDFTQPQNSMELSDDLHLTGGMLSMYDGNQVCEHGFHLYPEGVIATPSATGGSLTNGATYQFVVTYEWMDAQGLIHQSSPSPLIQAVVPAGGGTAGSVALTIPTLRLTSKKTPVSVVVWGTQGNQQVLYRLTNITSPLLNSTSVDTVAFTAAAADTVINGNAQIYSNPLNPLAEVPNLSLPAPLHVWRYRSRVCAIPSENPLQWLFSKAYNAGVPIEFNNQQLFQSVAQDGGPLTCGIEMDEKNILFTATRIYYVVGDGPSPNGGSSDYGQAPQSVPTDVGCVNRRSLVLTPLGIMFQSAKGIYLLTRGLQLVYIGAGIEAFNGLTVTAARLVSNNRRVVFYTNGGIALAYDYLSDKWTTWTSQSAADAIIFGGLLTYIKASGQLIQETPGLFTDLGAPVLIQLQTSILSFGGISGFQRVWRFGVRGDYKSPHALRIGVAFDDSPAPQQVEVANSATILSPGLLADSGLADTESPAGGAYPALEYVVKCLRQKCSSIQISIQETQSGPAYGEGLSLSGLAFVVGLLGRLHPVGKKNVV